MFHTPVTTRRLKAGQASRLNARAAMRGASVATVRSLGTRPASVSCPPTHTVAPSTWRKRRMVVAVTGSTAIATLATAQRSCLTESIVPAFRLIRDFGLCGDRGQSRIMEAPNRAPPKAQPEGWSDGFDARQCPLVHLRIGRRRAVGTCRAARWVRPFPASSTRCVVVRGTFQRRGTGGDGPDDPRES